MQCVPVAACLCVFVCVYVCVCVCVCARAGIASLTGLWRSHLYPYPCACVGGAWRAHTARQRTPTKHIYVHPHGARRPRNSTGLAPRRSRNNHARRHIEAHGTDPQRKYPRGSAPQRGLHARGKPTLSPRLKTNDRTVTHAGSQTLINHWTSTRKRTEGFARKVGKVLHTARLFRAQISRRANT
jgi:hypothetical protein